MHIEGPYGIPCIDLTSGYYQVFVLIAGGIGGPYHCQHHFVTLSPYYCQHYFVTLSLPTPPCHLITANTTLSPYHCQHRFVTLSLPTPLCHLITVVATTVIFTDDAIIVFLVIRRNSFFTLRLAHHLVCFPSTNPTFILSTRYHAYPEHVQISHA